MSTIDVHGDIDADDGVSASSVIAKLRKAGADITVSIHSGGGSLFEGLAIYSALKTHPGRVTVRIMGLAASAATIVAMAGDRIEVASTAWLMVHAPSAAMAGDSMTFRDTADLLDSTEQQMVDIYAARTRRPRREIERMIAAETWMTAGEAVRFGFADAVFTGAKVAARVDLSRFKNAPPKARKLLGKQPDDPVTKWRRAVAACGSARAAAKRYPKTRAAMVAAVNQQR